MIELLNVGDRVEMGSYRVLSRFRGATAFVRDGVSHLAVIVEENKGAGPCQVVVRGCDFARMESLVVLADRVVLDGAVFKINRRYRSQVKVGWGDSQRLGRNLQSFDRTLHESAPARSIIFASGSDSAFEAAVARQFHEGVDLLLAGELERGARTIAGLGFGLTPSGDDFLTGYLLGMFALGAPWAERNRIYEASRSPNIFSESMLRCALDGCCIEAARSLIHALFEGDEADVARQTTRLSAVGASSGAELAAGLYRVLASGVQEGKLKHAPPGADKPILSGVPA